MQQKKVDNHHLLQTGVFINVCLLTIRIIQKLLDGLQLNLKGCDTGQGADPAIYFLIFFNIV